VSYSQVEKEPAWEQSPQEVAQVTEENKYNLKGKLSLGQRQRLQHQEMRGRSFQEDENLGGQRGASPSIREQDKQLRKAKKQQ